MLVLGELPLSFIESAAWKHLCDKVNLYAPHSRRTCTKDIVKMYVGMKASLKTWIATTNPRVSLTTDIWTAKATVASYMVITAHFVDSAWKLRKLIIGFKYITDHKGAIIARILLECLAEWGIEKIFTITVDNATTNTSALKKFQETFSLRSNEAFVLEGEGMHVRCAAHIINLIVKEGLVELGDHVAAIRNSVQYVRSSTSRCDSFDQKVVSGKMTRGSLPLDIKTRWNSTYLMLKRAMEFRLAFDKMDAEDKLYNDYFNEVDDGNSKIGPPTRADWNAVERLVRFLIIFYNSTLVVSASNSVASYKCYGEIVTIETNLVSLGNNFDRDLKIKAKAMLGKFVKYWDGTRNINVYLIVASVFDPRKKMQFANMCFAKLYGKDTTDAKEMAEKLVDEIGVDDGRDELDVYLKEKVENPKTIIGLEWEVLSWWKLNCGRFPVLSAITKDVLAMQVSSVASESAFSNSGRVIEPHRSLDEECESLR
ncbi:putative HAT dimerization domain, ribonuclease H-like superfamily, hAT-like transposase, RNase-H [Arabidopsis thaliana]